MADKKVVFTFGRFSPPTVGHAKLINKVVSHAKETGAEHHVYSSKSHDPVKNPIPYDKKVGFLKKLFPNANVQDDPNAHTAFHVAKSLSDKGYEDVTMVVGADRVDNFKQQMGKYVKHKSEPGYDPKKHYSFKKFNVVSAGDRDENATGVEGMSGTKMRAAVRAGDFKTFAQGIPGNNLKTKKEIFATVKKHLKETTEEKTFGDHLQSFVDFASDHLGIKSLPKINVQGPDNSTEQKSFGGYNPSTKEIVVHTKNRHPMDIFRTVAHELVHHKQNLDGRIKDVHKEGSTGSKIENEANFKSGIIMRKYADAYPDYFSSSAVGGGIYEEALNEVFDKPLKWKLENSNQIQTSYTFITSKGKKYGVLFTKQGGNNFECDFSTTDNHGIATIELTKSGKEFEVYSTVIDIIKDFKKQYPEAKIIFSAEGHSRNKLYDIMAKKMGAKRITPAFNPRIKPSNFEEPVTGTYMFSEGLYDPAIFKAVFLAGGPGSGKDFIMHQTLDGLGLTEINSDIALEFLMKKEGLNFAMPETERQHRDLVRGRAKNISKEKQRLSLSGRLGLIINGTAENYGKMETIKKDLESLGYETMMIYVNTSNEVSQTRNIKRGLRGGRTVPEVIRVEKWKGAQENIGHYQQLFGLDHFIVIDNSHDHDMVSTDHKKALQKEILEIHKKVRNFIASGVHNSAAQQWIANTKAARGIKEDINIQFESYLEGTPEIVAAYKAATPGQHGKDDQTPQSKIKKYKYLQVKKLKDMLPQSIKIQEWALKESTQEKFIDKYGDQAEAKLIQTAQKLYEAFGNQPSSSSKKFLSEIRIQSSDNMPNADDIMELT
jgi:hypothetical protein